jgi:hypothetical protein
MTTLAATDRQAEATEVVQEFERLSGLVGIEWELRERSDGDILYIQVVQPSERLFQVLEKVMASRAPATLFPIRATLSRTAKENLLQSAESRLFLRVLSESLTINRHSFEDDFFDRYIKSVFGAEEQILSASNHIVFGRRGSGKSSLLLYAMHKLELSNAPFAWIDMQVYHQRSDNGVVVDIISEVVQQVGSHSIDRVTLESLRFRLDSMMERGSEVSETDIQTLLPTLKRFLGAISKDRGGVTVFLDDFHVIDRSLQPKLLSYIYSFARGNRIYLKLSAIETMTKNWDPATRSGLEVPHDAQVLRLDYNLTVPQKAAHHIRSILDRHAVYSGLPSVLILCYKMPVVDRLVWVAAGVPRDALSIFAQAMTKAAIEEKSGVSVTNINAAASEMADVKLRDLQLDSSGKFQHPVELLEEIKDFCVKRHKKNAFLVERKNDDPVFESILQLIDLRLLHVISEGITIREAGQKYMALILDYAFYIGLRAAKNIDLFNRGSGKARYEDLRKLPVFRGTVMIDAAAD